MSTTRRYAAAVAMLIIGTTATLMTMQHTSRATITPAEVEALTESDTAYIMLDVRTREEFDGPLGHIRGARLIPVRELEARLDELSPYRQKTIIAICRSGNRSGYATTLLQQHGFVALNMLGGMLRWQAEGRPAVHTEHP